MNVLFSHTHLRATEAELLEVEQLTGFTFPTDYRQFLLSDQVGRPDPAYFSVQWNKQEWASEWARDFVHFFLSVHNGKESKFLTYYNRYRGRIPDDTAVIAYDEGRNLILIRLSAQQYGQIFFWLGEEERGEDDHEDESRHENIGFIASNFSVFLGSLHEIK